MTAADGEAFVPRTPTGSDLTAVPVAELVVGDRIWADGAIREIVLHEDDDRGGVLVAFEDTDADDPLRLDPGLLVHLIEPGFFYLTPEEGLARAPHRMRADDWEARFSPVTDADGSIAVFDDVPTGTDERLVWTQVEGDEYEGWRDFALVPGIARANRLNYLLCRTPWAAADAEVEVDWN